MSRAVKKLIVASVVTLFAGFVVLNLIARNQAIAMTTFVDDGARTSRPEDLTIWEKVRVIASGVTVPRPRNQRVPLDLGLEFDQLLFPNGSGQVLSAWVIEADDPRLVVLLFHGYAACKESLLSTAAQLRDMGYSSMPIDFYGSGDSSGSGTSIGVHEAVDVAAALSCARSRWPESKLVLYGFSMGGAAVLRAVALEGATPDAIVLESVFDRLVNAAGMRFRAMGLPARPLADILLFWGGRAWGFNAKAHNPADYAGSVHCPALLLFGESDARVGNDQAEAIFANLGGKKRLVIIPGMGHQNAVSVAPDVWQKEVSAFLSRQLDLAAEDVNTEE